MNGLEEAERDLRQAGRTVEAFNAIKNAERERKHAEDRSLIVKSVIILYVVSIGLTILYLMYRGIFSNESTLASILDIIKIAILPVVTLVMGYYFGSAKT
jgi:heme/copper-type cytochrome/quinol oxidase subunit 4